MNWIKLPALATTLAATLIASPATAYADPVPTPDEVVAVMAKLTDPGRPAVPVGRWLRETLRGARHTCGTLMGLRGVPIAEIGRAHV